MALASWVTDCGCVESGAVTASRVIIDRTDANYEYTYNGTNDGVYVSRTLWPNGGDVTYWFLRINIDIQFESAIAPPFEPPGALIIVKVDGKTTYYDIAGNNVENLIILRKHLMDDCLIDVKLVPEEKRINP